MPNFITWVTMEKKEESPHSRYFRALITVKTTMTGWDDEHVSQGAWGVTHTRLRQHEKDVSKYNDRAGFANLTTWPSRRDIWKEFQFGRAWKMGAIRHFSDRSSRFVITIAGIYVTLGEDKCKLSLGKECCKGAYCSWNTEDDEDRPLTLPESIGAKEKDD